MENLKDKTLLFYDISGHYVSFAQRLSRDFGKVLYYTNWKSAYPSSNEVLVGEGLKEIERINDFWEHLNEVDIFFFADCYDGDLQEYLASIGKPVWGAKKGDELELDRMATIELMEKLKMPTPTVEVVTGLAELREYLKQNQDIYVKVARYRGDFETFGSKNYKIIEPVLDELEHRLGAKKYIAEFLCFKGIDAECETGIDIYTIDGKYPDKTLYGFEIKDMGYGGTVKNYKDLSELITDTNKKLSPILKEFNYRGFFSTELRITKDKTPYLIDLTCRIPSPPGALIQEMVSNLGEIIWGGANGEMVNPVFSDEYGIEIIIRSHWANTNWQSIYFPEEISRFVKIKNLTKIKGAYYYIPQSGVEMCEIGSVVATGKSLEECEKKVNEYISKIEGHGLEMNTEGIMMKLQEQIANAKKVGITF